MPERWMVSVDHVWKRYCRTLRRSVRYALVDSTRSFVGLPPRSTELREDEFWSLRDVSFRLARGEGLALVGTNGAGKSTMLKVLSGVIAPDRGEVRVRGRLVSMMMAGAGFHPVLTGRENIYIYGAILGMRRAEIERRIPEIVDFAELSEFLETPVKYYSTGMYMRLAFSIAAQSAPDVFIVDEVLAVGDVAFREKCIEHLLGMKKKGCTLLLVSHSSGHVRRLADHGVWLRRGECVAQGPIEGVLDGYLAEIETVAEAPRSAVTRPEPVAVEVPTEPRTASAPTIELVQQSDATPVPLVAHEETRLVFEVRFDGPCPEPTATLELATAAGTRIAGASVALSGTTYPQPRTGSVFTLAFDLKAHVGAMEGDLVLTVTRDADGGEERLATRRWPCCITGAVGSAGHLDLQAEFAVAAGADVAEWQQETVVIDPGAEVVTSVSIAGQPRAWLLLGAREEVVARAPLPTVVAPVVEVSGRFRANLAPGCYRQALEVGTGRILGPAVQVVEFAEPVGHVDLGARCHVVDFPPEDPAGTANDDIRGAAGIRLGQMLLDGSTASLESLLGEGPRVVADLSSASCGLTAMATGEECRARVRIHASRALENWDVSISFRHPERGRCAGMRLRRDVITRGPGAFDVCFAFTANLAPGEYLLGCSVSARDEDGEQIEAQSLDFIRCFVLGPGENGSDGRLDVVDLQESALSAPTEVPMPDAEAADLDGSGLRLLGFSVNGKSGDELALVRAGDVAAVEVDVLAVTDVQEPSFKFSFVNHGKRCVSRMSNFESAHRLGTMPAGEARRYQMRFRPHLAGGLYQIQVALLRRSGQRATVTDRRHQAAMCQVPARPRAIGPGWLEARLLVDAR